MLYTNIVSISSNVSFAAAGCKSISTLATAHRFGNAYLQALLPELEQIQSPVLSLPPLLESQALNSGMGSLPSQHLRPLAQRRS